MKSALALCLALLLSVTANAKAHRRSRPHTVKNFPATSESLRIENETADVMGVRRYLTEDEVNADVERGVLVAINEYPSLKIAKKLPRWRRYARPEAVAFIQLLSSEFYEANGHALIVDSAIRPASVQKRLRRWNRNAAPVDGERASTHQRGTTLDISRHMTKRDYRWLMIRFMYYRAIRHILVIEERSCIHIFIKE